MEYHTGAYIHEVFQADYLDNGEIATLRDAFMEGCRGDISKATILVLHIVIVAEEIGSENRPYRATYE